MDVDAELIESKLKALAIEESLKLGPPPELPQAMEKELIDNLMRIKAHELQSVEQHLRALASKQHAQMGSAPELSPQRERELLTLLKQPSRGFLHNQLNALRLSLDQVRLFLASFSPKTHPVREPGVPEWPNWMISCRPRALTRRFFECYKRPRVNPLAWASVAVLAGMIGFGAYYFQSGTKVKTVARGPASTALTPKATSTPSPRPSTNPTATVTASAPANIPVAAVKVAAMPNQAAPATAFLTPAEKLASKSPPMRREASMLAMPQKPATDLRPTTIARAPASTTRPARPAKLASVQNTKTASPNAGQPVRAIKVKQGDTLYKLAKQERTDVDSLRRLNRISGNLIHPGQQLIVPPKGTKNA